MPTYAWFIFVHIRTISDLLLKKMVFQNGYRAGRKGRILLSTPLSPSTAPHPESTPYPCQRFLLSLSNVQYVDEKSKKKFKKLLFPHIS
jgi:hypothetical protein